MGHVCRPKGCRKIWSFKVFSCINSDVPTLYLKFPLLTNQGPDLGVANGSVEVENTTSLVALLLLNEVLGHAQIFLAVWL